MLINNIIAHLEAFAPLSLQENYDNAGLITGVAGWECRGVLTCLDATEEVINEAIQKGCNLIVAHHPIIFGGLKRITGHNYVERAVIKAIKNDIAIYAIHTNLDNVIAGVNGKMADLLGLVNRRILLPKESKDIGSGLIGELETPQKEIDFLKNLKKEFNLPLIRHTPLLNKPIKRIALCGGAGSFLVPHALATGADVFITADMKYHEFFDADGRMLIADIGHYESEQFTIDLLYDVLREKFPTFAVLKTGVSTNPVRYFL